MRVPKRIAEYEAPFGICVQNFDGVPLHGCDHVAGTDSSTGRHVLDQSHDANNVGACLAQGNRSHHARDGACASHVHGHIFHAGCRFEADATCIEDDTLANERQRSCPLLAAVPLHDHDLRRAGGTLSYGQQSAHAKFSKIILFEHFHLEPDALHGREPLGKCCCREHVCRLIDQIAREKGTFGDRKQRRRRR